MSSTREMVEELARHLSTSSTSGGSTAFVIGTTIFANAQPHSTRATLALFETPGSPPGYHHGTAALPDWEMPHLQVVARSTAPASGATVPNPTNAKKLLRRAVSRLEGITNQAVQGSTYLRVEPISSLFLARVEDDGRQVFACNFEITRRPSTSGLN